GDQPGQALEGRLERRAEGVGERHDEHVVLRVDAPGRRRAGAHAVGDDLRVRPRAAIVCGITEDQAARVGGDDIPVEGVLHGYYVERTLARTEQDASHRGPFTILR